MRGKVELSRRAAADLEEIWNYSEDRWGAGQAEAYLREIWRRIEQVADDPRIGRSCDDVRPGYRRVSAGSHLVFFRIVDGRPQVTRVLHGRMDPHQHL